MIDKLESQIVHKRTRFRLLQCQIDRHAVRHPRQAHQLPQGERGRDVDADYIAEYESLPNAQYVLDRISKVLQSLSAFPERGNYPKELVALGIQEYRQTSFKPYRVIYRVHANQAVVYVIADGRRDMQSLLTRRLLGA